MNRLSVAERAAIIRCLVEGNSIRATARMTGAARNTITTLLVNLGKATAAYQDATLRNLTSERIQCDEIWAFCYAKAKNVPESKRDTFGYGDVWTWTAIDADTKLVPTWLVGSRDEWAAHDFIADLASRLANRVQITTDGHRPYLAAIESEFGSNVDFAQIIKTYGVQKSEDASPTARRYSPNVVTGIEVRAVSGDPDPDHISTSYVERQRIAHFPECMQPMLDHVTGMLSLLATGNVTRQDSRTNPDITSDIGPEYRVLIRGAVTNDAATLTLPERQSANPALPERVDCRTMIHPFAQAHTFHQAVINCPNRSLQPACPVCCNPRVNCLGF